ncbi:MAG: hypothetical protein ACKOZT_15080 [Cyanobium sp.]
MQAIAIQTIAMPGILYGLVSAAMIVPSVVRELLCLDAMAFARFLELTQAAFGGCRN